MKRPVGLLACIINGIVVGGLTAMDSGPLWPLALYFGLVVLTVAGMIGISALLGQKHREHATAEPYESGIVSTGSARLRLPVKFYLVAVLFVMFDLEAVFLYGWAVAVREVGWPGFFEMLVFVAVLLAALLYLWRTGALDWGGIARGRRGMPED